MTRINSKLKVAGILLAALVLALLSVVQISATPFTDPIGYIAYRDKLAELRSANPGITRSEAPAVLVEVKLVDPHTWWQGQRCPARGGRATGTRVPGLESSTLLSAARRAAGVRVSGVDRSSPWPGSRREHGNKPMRALGNGRLHDETAYYSSRLRAN
jgi:hypothetical protein